jgi:hypothetical protein
MSADPSLTPTMDVDVSWVICRSSFKTMTSQIHHVMKLVDVFTKNGICVVLVCDGDKRYHTKQATIHRRGLVYKNKVKLYFPDAKLSVTVILLQNQEELLKKSKWFEPILQANNADVGNSLVELILLEVQKYNKKHESLQNKVIFLQAVMQADNTIAYRFMNGIADLALMSDMDFRAMVGELCLSIAQYAVAEGKNRNTTIDHITLYTPSYNVINFVCNILNLDINKNRVLFLFPNTRYLTTLPIPGFWLF